MKLNEWNHVVMVVDRDTGRLKQYLNGQLTAENFFDPGKQEKFPWEIGSLEECQP